ncbi:MAG: dUTP diphosphatase [Proteobacteria bacterium]|nr:dUTP diphosphatase [Pseudomonadota bacterium]
MIRFKVKNVQDNCLLPYYATSLSVAADLKSAIDYLLTAGSQARIPTGLWIDHIDTSRLADGMMVELQVRARSGLAYKHGLTLTNGIGTIDADYPGEICVLLWNSSAKDFEIKRGDRIAQICAHFLPRLDVPILSENRVGGFGSTGL